MFLSQLANLEIRRQTTRLKKLMWVFCQDNTGRELTAEIDVASPKSTCSLVAFFRSTHPAWRLDASHRLVAARGTHES
jgi:hypothetical protein